MTKTTQYKWFKIHTCPDENAEHESPRNRDNLGKVVMFFNNYSYPNELDIDKNNQNNREGLKIDLLKLEYDVVKPIYLLSHSGHTIKTTPFSCNWDSWQVWFIAAKIPEGSSFQKVEAILIQEIKVYDQRIRWDYYEFEIKELAEVSGGYDDEEAALMEAKATIDDHIKTNNTNVYEYEIELRVTREIRIEAKSEDDAQDALDSEDYKTITESCDEIINKKLLSTKRKYDEQNSET